MNLPRAEKGIDRRHGEAGAPDGPERLPLVRKVASLIAGYKGREGLVIGIEGPWGAGKTTFTGQVLKALQTNAGTTVLPFNPWSLSDQHALSAEFVAALGGAIAEEQAPAVPLSYAARLRATAARSLRLSPRATAPARAPQYERGDIQQKLAALDGRIVAIMEDIDRLDHEQTRLVMKLVRIASSLPNLVFLLVYDRQRVAESLDESGRSGDDVLKTLVHIAFTLPEPTRQELNSALAGRVREAVTRAFAATVHPEDDERWRELVFETLPPLFTTLADVAGYSSSLRLAWTAVGPNTVDMADFIGIEAIRYFAPQLYAAMASNRGLLTAGLGGDAAERQSRYEDLLREAPEKTRAGLDAVVRFLFPMLSSEQPDDERRTAWATQKRVASPQHFGHSFELGVPALRVSETEVLFLRRRFDDPTAVADFLNAYLSDGRLAPLLAQVPTQPRFVSESDARALLLGLWTLEPALEGGSPACEETRAAALELGRNLLRDAIAPERRAAFLDEIVASTDARAFPAALVAALEADPLS